MGVIVHYTASFDQDYSAHRHADRQRIDAAVGLIRHVAVDWTEGPLPLQQFAPELRIHPVDPGIYAADWEPRNGRMTFALDDVDSTGYPERLVLRRVGGHAIYRDP